MFKNVTTMPKIENHKIFQKVTHKQIHLTNQGGYSEYYELKTNTQESLCLKLDIQRSMM